MFTDFLQDVTVNKSSVESERSALTFRPSPRLALELGRLAAASLCQVLHRSPPRTKQWNEAADLLFQEFTHLVWVQQNMDDQRTQSEEVWVSQRQSPGCKAFLRQRLLTHERAVVLHLAECCRRVLQLSQTLGHEEEEIHPVLLQSAEWAMAGLLVLGSVEHGLSGHNLLHCTCDSPICRTIAEGSKIREMLSHGLPEVSDIQP